MLKVKMVSQTPSSSPAPVKVTLTVKIIILLASLVFILLKLFILWVGGWGCRDKFSQISQYFLKLERKYVSEANMLAEFYFGSHCKAKSTDMVITNQIFFKTPFLIFMQSIAMRKSLTFKNIYF